MDSDDVVAEAAEVVRAGGVVGYPTEGVFGLGCDPFNELAVRRILAIKRRSPEKGFIVIAAKWDHLESLVSPIPKRQMDRVFESWPGAVTWVFPASGSVPVWVRGSHETIAIRLTAHPIARALCLACDIPLISTSANREGEEPLRSAGAVRAEWGDEIDQVVLGSVGDLKGPTPIKDALTGYQLR